MDCKMLQELDLTKEMWLEFLAEIKNCDHSFDKIIFCASMAEIDPRTPPSLQKSMRIAMLAIALGKLVSSGHASIIFRRTDEPAKPA